MKNTTRRIRLSMLLVSMLSAYVQFTWAAPIGSTVLPSNGVVTAGSASVSTHGNVMTVTQSTQNAIINWDSFNIGSSAAVRFVDPSSSSWTLNRVLSANPSQIYGSLSSNGTVFLVNPQGIVVGPGAQVNVGGLVASSLNISDGDFLARHLNFSGSGANGAVSNAGTITVAQDGFAALIGGQVSNTGVISARMGSVALASGNQLTLAVDDSGLLSVGVTQGTLDALVSNGGSIMADGGRIIMTAKSANDVLSTVVNNSGLLQANSVAERNGQIWMLAADPLANTGATGAAANLGTVHNAAGAVVSTGTIDVSSNATTAAGQVTMAGSTVELGGTINASNSDGAAGRVLINSTQGTTVDAAARIDVQSTGGAGSAILWSDQGTTAFHGSVDGQGSGATGQGAHVEISSGQNILVDGAVSLGAAVAGRAGSLLLDPATLEIASGAGGGSCTGPSCVTQNFLQSASGNITLNADGQITVDALSGNVLNLAGASSFALTSNNTGGIRFLNNGAGAPSGITTNGAAVSLTASGNGSLLNVGQITTHGGNVNLSGISVQLGAGVDASLLGNGAGNGGAVDVAVFGGGILGNSTGVLSGSQLTLDATYGYIGLASTAVKTNTTALTIKTGGNAFVSDQASINSLSLFSNHLMGSPVSIQLTAPDIALSGQDVTGDGSLYASSVKWVSYSATTNGAGAGPATFNLTQDSNLLPSAMVLPGSNLTLTSSNADILGGNSTPLTAQSLVLRSPYAIGGINAAGNVDSFINGSSASDGLALATSVSGNIDAQVRNTTGAVSNGSIISLNQSGNLLGDADATYVNLAASGNIGSSSSPFVVHFAGVPVSGDGSYHSIMVGGASVWVDSDYSGSWWTNRNLIFDNVQASGGGLSLSITDALGNVGNSSVTVQHASATGALNITGHYLGTYGYSGLNVLNAASNTSINISDINSHGSLYVDSAVLNGSDSVSRTISISNDGGDIHTGILSTNGSVSASAATPLGIVNISAPAGVIYNDAYEVGVLRAGTANITAANGINFQHEYVDTATQLNLTVNNSGNLSFQGYGIDSVTDPSGQSTAHSLQLHSIVSHANTGNYGYYSINVSNGNGGLNVGQVSADGSSGSAAGLITLSANNGAIVASGVSGGIINASNNSNGGGSITLSSTGNNGGLGVFAGQALHLSASNLSLTTSGNMNVLNSENSLGTVTVNLDYAANAAANRYSFLSGTSATPSTSANSINFLASTPGAATGGSSNNVLTVAASSLGNTVSSFTLNADGNLQVSGLSSAAQNAALNASNIMVGSLSSAAPALSVSAGNFSITASSALTIGSMTADNANLSFTADNGNLTLNTLSSALSPGHASQYAQVTAVAANGNVLINNLQTSGASVSIAETGGNLTVGNVQDSTINGNAGTVVLNAYSGNILAVNSSNLVAANTVTLNSRVGNMGASATPLNIAAGNSLTVDNQPASAGQGGGGSIYLQTANDPANLVLDLSNNSAGSSTLAITPMASSNPNGLTLIGSTDQSGITLSNLGVAGTAPATQVSNIVIVADAPTININSGVNGSQTLAPVSYTLTPGVNAYSGVDSANAQTSINLSGSSGKLVTLDLNNGSTSNTITGQLSLTGLQINANSSQGNSATPLGVNFTLEQALNTFTLNRSGDAQSTDHYQLTDGGSTGQSFLAGSGSGQMLVSGGNTGVHPLNLTLAVSGEPLEVGNLAFGSADTLTLSATTITGSNSNQLTAGTVNLVANGGYQSAIGGNGQAVNIAAGGLALTTQGSFDINVDNSSAAPSLALASLAINVSHPASGSTEPTYGSSYQIGGDVSLTASDVASTLNTTLVLSASNLGFSFSTDRNLVVGNAAATGISDAGGHVSLSSNGDYSSWHDYTPIGIEQYAGGSGITASAVSLNATGYLGHVGTSSTALQLNTPSLSVNTNGSFNLQDSAALHNLSLTLADGRDHNNNFPVNSYALTDGGNLSLSLIDNNTCNCNWTPNGSSLQLANLTSNTLSNFSLTLTDSAMPLMLGRWNGSSFTGQINLSAANSTVSLTSANGIYLVSGYGIAGASSLADSPSTVLSSSQAVVVANTLNLVAAGQIAYSSYLGWYNNTQNAVPVEVNTLSLSSGSNAYVANIGSVNVTAAQASNNVYLQAIASGSAASISASGVIASPNVGLTANYGNIGSASNAVTTNTGIMNLYGGGDMYVSNQSLLSQLSIVSLHHKSVTGSGTTNTLVISDSTLSGGGALQLGVTDQALGGGLYQYQMNGLNEPNLAFSFTSDAGLSLGNLLASTIALRSYNGNIYEMPGDVGVTTAGSVSMMVDTSGDSIGANGHPVQISSSDISFTTGYNLYVKDGSVISSLGLQTYDLSSGAPVYSIDNSAAPAASRLTFNVTADTANQVMNINNITMATPSGENENSLSVGSYSSIAVNAINVPGSGGQVSLGSRDRNIFGMNGAAGVVADSVTLGLGDGAGNMTIGSQSLPVLVDTASLTIGEYVNDNLYVSFVAHPTRTLANVAITQTSVAASNVISINDGSVFSLSGGSNGNGSFSLLSATGSASNLSYATNSDFHIANLSLGSGNLSLSSNYNSINADGGTASLPNIVTTGTVSLYAAGDLGHDSSTAIYTNIAGNVGLTALGGNINLTQGVSTTPLNISGIGTASYGNSGGSINIRSAGDLNLLSGVGFGYGPVTLQAAGNFSFAGNLSVNRSAVSITATNGSISGGNIYGASGVSLTAAQNITVGDIDNNTPNPGNGQGAASNAITLHAIQGNVTLNGNVMSQVSDTIIAGGNIISTVNDNIGLTPLLNLQAGGNISGSNGNVWRLNGISNNGAYVSYLNNPGTLTLNAISTGGSINLASTAAVDITALKGHGNVALGVYGDYLSPNAGIVIEADTSGNASGTVSSAAGSVMLATADGNITGVSGNLIKAANTVALLASQPLTQNYSGSSFNGTIPLNTTIYNIGSSSQAIDIAAAQVNLTANGNIYATLPATGVTGISVGRSYVNPGNLSNWSSLSALMPGGTVLITDGNSHNIVSINDTGVGSGGVAGQSTLNVNYGTALNFSYASYDPIRLGTVTLNSGGALTLGVSNPFDVSITSANSAITAGQLTFNLNPTENWASPSTLASGGFGTANNPINTQISSISGSTTGTTAGFYVNQTGALTIDNLSTGGGIGVTASGNITLVNTISSANGNVSLSAGSSDILSSNGTPASLSASNGTITLTGAALSLPSGTINANGVVTLTTNSGDMNLAGAAVASAAGIVLSASNGNLNLASGGSVSAGTDASLTAGSVTLGSSVLHASGNLGIAATGGLLDFSSSTTSATNVTAAAGSITTGSIAASTDVLLVASGSIEGNTQNNAGVSASNITLTAGTGIGDTTPVLLTGSGNITGSSTSGNISLLTGQSGDLGHSAVLNLSTGAGAITVDNNYGTLELANISSGGNGTSWLGNVAIQNLMNNGTIQIDNVTASGPGAMVSIKAASGSIVDQYLGSGVAASRIVLDSLGLGGSITSNHAGVQVNGQAVVAVSSGDIYLDSLNTNLSQMPLVASNGNAQTVSITSAGDFQVGQIVAGLQAGTVNINSAGGIFDDNNLLTKIYAASVNLTAQGAIGSSSDPIAIAAHNYTNNTGGIITASSTVSGGIYLNQSGDVTLQSVTTANGLINVNVAGNTFVNIADASATDALGNDVTINLSSGDMVVNQAFAGSNHGNVSLTASTGSVLGYQYVSENNQTLRDCCTDPHVIANAASVTARNNIGFNGTDSSNALSIRSGQVSTSTSANNATTILYLLGSDGAGNVALGGSSYSFTALGSGSTVEVRACHDLDLSGMGSGSGWLHTGVNANVELLAGHDLLLPSSLSTESQISALTLVGSHDVYAPGNVSGTQHTLTINTPNLLLQTGAAAASDTTDPLVVNVTGGHAADVVVSGSTPTSLTINTDGNTVISASNPEGNVTASTSSGNLNVFAIRDAGYTVSLLAPAGGVVQAAQDNLGYFNTAGIAANGLMFNLLNGLGSANRALVLQVNSVGANINSSGGIYLSLSPLTGSSIGITGLTTSNGDIQVASSSGSLLLEGAVRAGASGGNNVSLLAAGALVDEYGNGTTPTVTGNAVSLGANGGSISQTDITAPMWLQAASVTAAANGSINLFDMAPGNVTLGPVATNNGNVRFESGASIALQTINAGTGNVTVISDNGSVSDGTGQASWNQPNVWSTGTVVLQGQTFAGSAADSLWVNYYPLGIKNFSGGTTPLAATWINYVPPSPYPSQPTVPNVKPQTTWSVLSQSITTPVLILPYVPTGSLVRIADPIKVDVASLGVSLPRFLNQDSVQQQDDAFGTTPQGVQGGNETEIGRKK